MISAGFTMDGKYLGKKEIYGDALFDRKKEIYNSMVFKDKKFKS